MCGIIRALIVAARTRTRCRRPGHPRLRLSARRWGLCRYQPAVHCRRKSFPSKRAMAAVRKPRLTIGHMMLSVAFMASVFAFKKHADKVGYSNTQRVFASLMMGVMYAL